MTALGAQVTGAPRAAGRVSPPRHGLNQPLDNPRTQSANANMRHPAWEKVIRRSWLFDHPTTGDAFLIGDIPVSALRFADFPSGHKIFAEGQPGDRVYVIISGIVKLACTVAHRRQVVRALLGPGDVLGELTTFDTAPHSGTATCQSLVRTAWLTTSSVRGLIRRQPELTNRWLQALAHQIRSRDAELVGMSSVDVAARVARQLVMLAQRFGEEVDGTLCVHHSLTRREFAELVGASKESVSRALAEFVERGWLVTTSGGFELLDLDQVRHRAQVAFQDLT